MNDYSAAQKYFSDLEEYKNNLNFDLSPFNEVRANFSKAILLKANERLRVRMTSEEIFRDIISAKSIDTAYIVLSIKHLCDLLLDELKISENISVLSELSDLIRKMQEVGIKGHSFATIVEALILRFKLALIEGNIDEAQLLLDQADKMASKHGFIHLENQIQDEKRGLESELNRWKTLIDQNAPLSKRLKEAQLQSYIKEALKITQR